MKKIKKKKKKKKKKINKEHKYHWIFLISTNIGYLKFKKNELLFVC